MQICSTSRDPTTGRITTSNCRDEPSRARPATTATAGTKTGSAPGLKYNTKLVFNPQTLSNLEYTPTGTVIGHPLETMAVPAALGSGKGKILKELGQTVATAAAYVGLDYIANKITAPKQTQEVTTPSMAVSDRYDNPSTPAVEIAAPGIGAALQRLVPGGGTGLTTAPTIHGFVVKTWSTGTAQFAQYQDGTLATITKSGRLKTWKPYHPVVFGKRSDPRKLARVIKKHHRDWKELNKVFGKKRSTSCKRK